MMKRIVVLILISTCFSFAGEKKSKTDPVMSDVTTRGRALYEYDQAAWHATDAVLGMHPPEDYRPRYIARKSDSGWTVVFGVLNEQRDKFVVGYEARQGASLRDFTGKKLEQPREETGFYLTAAKAVDTALRDFRGQNRPYNAAVLPAANEQLYVYVYPAQTKSDVYPLGGDVRYLVAADGNTIVEKRELHKTILETSTQSLPKGATPEAGLHTHVLSEVPEDTDIFYVLTRQPPQTEYIGTRTKKLFAISTDGTIHEGKL